MIITVSFTYNDGGRSKYFKGKAGDCAARAMSIALRLDYKQCYNELSLAHKARTGKRTARDGILKNDFSEVLAQHSWQWMSAPKFIGRKARCSDLTGTVIARQAGHYVAVIDGIPHDTFDSSRKMVYGYWAKQ